MAFIDKLRSVFGWSGPRPPRSTARDPELDSAFMPVNPVDQYHDMMETRKQKRRDRYDVYDAMDRMSDVSSVLDAYAEDCTQTDHGREATVWVEGDDENVVAELNDMFHRVGVEEWIEGNARDLSKYGDDFARVIGTPEEGIVGLEWRDPRDIERIENRDGIVIGYETMITISDYVQRLQEDPEAIPTYKPWEFLHWRIYKQKRLPFEKYRHIYGTSLLWAADRIAKQVKILDDLLMVVRMTRSLDHKIYYVDTGRSPVEEEVRILKRWRRALKRKTYIDPAGGRFDSRFNPFAWTEDEFWPVKEGTNSKVENIPGLGNISDMVDIDHFRDKFFGAFRAPKAYFGYEGEINAKATLSSQSIRWARAVNALQRSIKQGLTRLCQIHLAYKDLDYDSTKFKVTMVTPSAIELLDRLEAWQVIVDVAERLSTLGDTLMLDKKTWTEYILRNTLWLSKQDIDKFVVALKASPALSGASGDSGDTATPDADQPPEQPEQEKVSRLVEIEKAISRISIQRPISGANARELPVRSPRSRGFCPPEPGSAGG